MISISQARKYFISSLPTIKRTKRQREKTTTTPTKSIPRLCICVFINLWRAFAVLECKRCLIKIDNLFSTPINFIPFINFRLLVRSFVVFHFWQMRCERARVHTKCGKPTTMNQREYRYAIAFPVLRKIYLLDITNRNKEVDLNYRSAPLCIFGFDNNTYKRILSAFSIQSKPKKKKI